MGGFWGGGVWNGGAVGVTCRWDVCGEKDMVRIGCIEKSISEWDEFFAGEGELETPRNTRAFKMIRANYEAIKRYLEIMSVQ